MDAYGEMILELAKHPVHKERLTEPTISYTKTNTSCGDTITVDLLITSNIITAIGWDGQGCAISQAAMSIVAEELTATTVHAAETMSVAQIIEALGITISARRMRCAELGLQAIKEAILQYKNQQKN